MAVSTSFFKASEFISTKDQSGLLCFLEKTGKKASKDQHKTIRREKETNENREFVSQSNCPETGGIWNRLGKKRKIEAG